MNVVEESGGEGGIKGIDGGHQYGSLSRQLKMLAEECDGDYARGQHYGLCNLNGKRGGKEAIERKNQIVDGRKMHAEMRHRYVTFRRDEREPRFLHVVEHINEEAEVEIGRREGEVTKAGDDGNHGAAKDAEGCRGNPNCFVTRLPFLPQIRILLYKIDGEQTKDGGYGQGEEKLVFRIFITEKPSHDADGGSQH